MVSRKLPAYVPAELFAAVLQDVANTPAAIGTRKFDATNVAQVLKALLAAYRAWPLPVDATRERRAMRRPRRGDGGRAAVERWLLAFHFAGVVAAAAVGARLQIRHRP